MSLERFAPLFSRGDTVLFVWDVDPALRFFSPNVERVLGFSAEALTSGAVDFDARIHPDDVQRIAANMGELVDEDGANRRIEDYRFQHADGRWIWLAQTVLVERGAEGDPTWTGTLVDVSFRHEAAEQLVRSERIARAAVETRRRFLATMSHEIRTPLHGILGMLQLIDDGGLDVEQRACLEVVRQSGDSLLVLINDILDVAKLEEGQLHLDARPNALPTIFQQVGALFHGRAGANGVALEVVLGPSLPAWGRLDAHRLRQILMNLLSNAVKFTERGKVVLRVDAEWRKDARELVFAVEDTGRGIADAAAIWEAFQQEDVSIAEAYGGTGLGLSICKMLVQAMGGTIEVDSQLGVGTTFTVRLPLEVVERGEQGALRMIDPDAIPRMRVLVAEDNAVNQLVVGGLLGRWKQRYTLVDDGAQAVRACQEDTWDVILMDVRMPEPDGIEATRHIRALPGPQPWIVGLSADAFQDTRDQCLEAGMDGFLSKPFRQEELFEVLVAAKKHMDRQAAARANRAPRPTPREVVPGDRPEPVTGA